MGAYYNEHDPFAAAWLRELIKAGHIAPGEVDERSIEDVVPSELRRFTQCHFFAGIGVWSYALRRAGWPDDREVWTGSCPCQPFSAAGKRGGVTDERHLWPAFFHLIKERLPAAVFGEQVASKDGLAWLDTVYSDMEGEGYTFGPEDLCAAGFGAPHVRQRLYFVGSRDVDNASTQRLSLRSSETLSGGEARGINQRSSDAGRTLADSTIGTDNRSVTQSNLRTIQKSDGEVYARELADSGHMQWSPRTTGGQQQSISPVPQRLAGRSQDGGLAGQTLVGPGFTNGFWRDAEWIFCRDQKYRPIEPGSSPLATGVTNRVGKLRGYGNALTAQVAQGFIEAYLETEETWVA